MHYEYNLNKETFFEQLFIIRDTIIYLHSVTQPL